ncbi:hypothetical protein SCP_0115570 [Sparassis crispa]|uniref:Uncharacterized protein n=1 Tax=Sparassis crispa TaxID=139825 RepID=A0A401G912_9APHY|nr:hypothetical protein SCP_0115570 [Sparassis crispa]GBE78666.1 hypothetical protein SCP_0115570 [Sparassis crispa]
MEWMEPVYTEHWLNRAAAYLRLCAYKHAEQDADEAIRRERSAKALYRRGRARRSLGRRACRYTRSLAT